jgi:hypothetical protein
MITITLYCSMCGNEKRFDDIKLTDGGATLSSLISTLGWIAQSNYPNLDIYCSKRCAL